jgi:predicted hydrocarbon binding protein
MKGSVFNGFEEYVVHNYDLYLWQQIIEETDLISQGVYLASDTYEDHELLSLISGLSNKTAIPESDIQRAFGAFFFNSLFSIMSQHVEHIDSLFDFLRAVDDVIHVEVKKADPSAYTPAFFYDQPSESTLVMRYVSKRGMCYFAEGLIIGAAKKFNTEAKISQSKCMHCGDKYCLINIKI